MDVKKTTEELRPARIVHRVAEFLEEMESSQSSPLPIEKKLNGKYVMIGDKRAGYVCAGAWQWCAFAKGRYSLEQLDSAEGYAEEA